MDNIEIQEIAVPVDQREHMFDRLLNVLHNVIHQSQISHVRASFAPEAPDILVIDSNERRAQYLAYVLTTAHYHPFVAANSLGAYTHIVQDAYIPRVVILSQDDNLDSYFFQQLLPQMSQRYKRDIPLIRLVSARTRQGSPQTQPVQNGPHSYSGNPYTHPVSPQTPNQPGHYKRVPFVPTNQPSTAPLSGFQQKTGGSQPLSSVERNVSTHSTLSDRRLPYSSGGRENFPEGKDSPNIPLEGQSFGRYKVRTRLGGNPTGNVYRAYDLLLEHDVALKIIPEEKVAFPVTGGELEPAHLFQEEVDFLAHIEHPHILPLLNCGKGYVSGYPFIYKVMPFCSEGSLADWLTQRGGSRLFALQDVVRIVWQLADALQHLHNQHNIYQNFKLSNILIHNTSKESQHLHVMLVDCAVIHGNRSTMRIEGTYPYRAPEQWLGQAIPASDQYALAALAYELLTGRPPFQGTTEHVMKRLHLNMPPPSPGTFNSALSSAVDRVLLQALSKNPLDRFSSISVFARTFQHYSTQ